MTDSTGFCSSIDSIEVTIDLGMASYDRHECYKCLKVASLNSITFYHLRFDPCTSDFCYSSAHLLPLGSRHQSSHSIGQLLESLTELSKCSRHEF